MKIRITESQLNNLIHNTIKIVLEEEKNTDPFDPSRFGKPHPVHGSIQTCREDGYSYSYYLINDYKILVGYKSDDLDEVKSQARDYLKNNERNIYNHSDFEYFSIRLVKDPRDYGLDPMCDNDWCENYYDDDDDD